MKSNWLSVLFVCFAVSCFVYTIIDINSNTNSFVTVITAVGSPAWLLNAWIVAE